MSGGGAWVTGDLISASRLNQKTLYIGSSAPSSPTDGQLWYDTSQKCLKVYNYEKSAWLRAQLFSLWLDDSTVSSTGTSEVEKKTGRFIIDSNLTIKNIYVAVSLKSSSTSGTAYVKIYANSEGTARATFSTTSTSETYQGSFVDVSDLSAGIHTLRLKTSNSGSYTTTNYIWWVCVVGGA